MPKELRWCAHRNLHKSFCFPLYCFDNETETSRFPVEDLMLLHEGTMETLALKLAKPEDIPQLEKLADLLLGAIKNFLEETGLA